MAAKGTTTYGRSHNDDHDEGTKDHPATDQPKNEKLADVKAKAVKAAHDAVEAANARKRDLDKQTAETAEAQRKKAAADVAKDEETKAKSEADQRGEAIDLPDIDPQTPLTRDEQNAVAEAKAALARAEDPYEPPLTEEAQQRMAEDAKLPKPGPIVEARAGVSATNPALMRNDIDVAKTPPFGRGAYASLQG